MKTLQSTSFNYVGSIAKLFIIVSIFTTNILSAQTVIDKIVQEETNNSQLQKLLFGVFIGRGIEFV